MRTFLGLVVVAGSALLLSTQVGCAKRGKGVAKVDKEAVKEFILDDMPADVTHKTDVNFEDKVHLIGWKAEPELAAPGSTVRFTLFWRKTGDLDPGWKLFTHVTTDDVKQAKGNLDCVGSIRQEKAANCTVQTYGPSDWEKGKVIKDSFEFTVPGDVSWPTYRFLVGIWKDDARLKIKNADANDGDNRANVIALPTGVKAPEPPPQKTELPTLNAPKFGKADIKIDGKLDEKPWETAGFTGPFVGPGDGQAPPDHPVNAAAKIAWDDANLYVGFVVEDKDPTSPFKPADKDPHVWEKSSAVELMIQPGDPGDNKDYFELQVDVNGAIFDTRWDDYNQPITGADDATKQFGHMDWSSGLKQAVTIDKEKKNYTAEIAIPWASFKAREGISIPPKPGDTWRVNLYSFKDGQRAALAWSPILGQGNFHKSTRFGKITFAGPGGLLPAASASAAASGSAAPDTHHSGPKLIPMPPGLIHPKVVPPPTPPH
ncbi:MAG: carbohydrate-binding family 9-like protein [Deltaproteobacteria bacterium]|nr:carbohydrate-binding family 9-like protein [Deltaproteobacteria bacterium]